MTATLFPTSHKHGFVEELSVVDPFLAYRFLTIYREAFAPLETLAPARQGLTDQEFLEQMADESVIKFVAWDRHHEPMALAFMATDLSMVPWISLPYFKARFPEHFARRAIYYFGALLVGPSRQGGPWAGLVLHAAARRVAAGDAIAVFDCCDYNVGRKLPDMIARAGSSVGPIETQELEAQRYFAYSTVKS